MRHYSLLVLIPERMTPPGAPQGVMTEAERTAAMNAASALRDRVARGSRSQGTVDVTIKVPTTPFPDTDYFTLLSAGDWYPHPFLMGQRTGDISAGGVSEHDFVAAFTATVQGPSARFLGYTLTESFYVNVTEPYKYGLTVEDVALHELIHAMSYHMEVDEGVSAGWPACPANDGPTRGIHCSQTYGYANDDDPAWLDDYLAGVVGGNLGISPAAWAVQTPTELGNRTAPRSRLYPTPWGTLGPFRIPRLT
jgi:hypothetical protein